jgi:hypothetical protein
MVSLAHLWLPILLSGIFVFIASSIVHMAFKFWHNPDYHGLPNESEVDAAIRKGNPAHGMYLLPYCEMEDMKKPESRQKFEQGPVGFLILRRPGKFSMGKPLVLWFVFCIVVAFFAAYIASRTLAAGTAHMQVFRIVSTTAFMGFAFGALPMGIWWAQPWRAVTKDVVDGLIYALVTGAVFLWLWPT